MLTAVIYSDVYTCYEFTSYLSYGSFSPSYKQTNKQTPSEGVRTFLWAKSILMVIIDRYRSTIKERLTFANIGMDNKYKEQV